MESKRILKSAVLCLLVGTCVAQFQQQNPFFNQQQQQQQHHQKQHNQQHHQKQHNQQPQLQQQNPFFNQQQQHHQQAQRHYQHQQQQPRSFNQVQPNNNFVQPQQQHFASSAQCPEANGRFPVNSQCDAYIECKDGVGEEKLCPEGLLFNPEARFNYPCGYPIDIKCEGRSALQPAQPTEDCPHQYGYFKMGDQRNCGKFMNCVEGRGYVFDCPEGLAYNPETYRCDWPDQVSDCDAEAYLGFTCPTSGQNSFLNSESRFYRSPNDCQRYYVCVDGRPRLQNCGEGNAFNELIGTCDAAENVTGCEPPFRENLQTLSLHSNSGQIDVRSRQQQNTYNQAHNFGFQQQPQQQQYRQLQLDKQQQHQDRQQQYQDGQQQNQDRQQQYQDSQQQYQDRQQQYQGRQQQHQLQQDRQQQHQQNYRGVQTFRSNLGNNNQYTRSQFVKK